MSDDLQPMNEEELMRMDTLINLLSKFGTASDRTTQTSVTRGFRLNREQLEELYRFNHYAARIIDLVPHECTRRGFMFAAKDLDDEESTQALLDVVQRLKVVEKMAQAHKWARLYGGAAIILNIDDGRDPSLPLNERAIARGGGIPGTVRHLHVLDRWSLIAGPPELNPALPWFNSPAYYTIVDRDTQGGYGVESEGEGFELSNLKDVGQRVHASRMLLFLGVELPPGLRQQEDYWGDPILNRLFTPLTNLSLMENGVANISQTFVQSIFKMAGLRNLLKSEKGLEEFRTRLIAMNLSQSLLSMMAMDAEGEDFIKRTTNVTGLDALFDRLAQSYAAAVGGPMTKVFGITPAGMSTDDESGARNWDNEISGQQSEHYIPPLNRFIDILRATDEGPQLDSEVVVEARPLREPTEDDSANTAKTWAETAAIMIDRSVWYPEEVRGSWSGSSKIGDRVLLLDGLEQEQGDDEPPEPEGFPGGVEEDERDDVRALIPIIALSKEAGARGLGCDRCVYYDGVSRCNVLDRIIDDDRFCLLQGSDQEQGVDGKGRPPSAVVFAAALQGWSMDKRRLFTDAYSVAREKLTAEGELSGEHIELAARSIALDAVAEEQ